MKVFYKQVQLNPTTETDYTDLVNKPSINGVELEGDLSTEQIKVTWYGTQEEFDALPSHDPYTFYIIDDGTPVGTQDSYLDLADKPSINGQVLTGNKLPSDLDMYSRPDVDNLLASMRSIKVVATKPAAPAANTMYYVGPDSESNYHVYLYDALLNEIDLGMAMNQLYREGTAIDIDSANTISVKIDDETIKTNTNNEIYVKKLDTALTKGANTTDAVKAVWVDFGDVKEHTVSSGTSTRPVYIDAGTIKPVNQAASGAYSNFVPYVDGSAVMDAGQYLDFHEKTSTNDYDVRLNYDGNSKLLTLRNAQDSSQNGIVITSGIVNTTPVPLKTLTALNATQIASNANLNTATYCTVGNYVSGANSAVAAYTNCPTSSAFRLTVESLRASKVDASDFGT